MSRECVVVIQAVSWALRQGIQHTGARHDVGISLHCVSVVATRRHPGGNLLQLYHYFNIQRTGAVCLHRQLSVQWEHGSSYR